MGWYHDRRAEGVIIKKTQRNGRNGHYRSFTWRLTVVWVWLYMSLSSSAYLRSSKVRAFAIKNLKRWHTESLLARPLPIHPSHDPNPGFPVRALNRRHRRFFDVHGEIPRYLA